VAPRILMIEDDERLAAMVSEYLATSGLQVTVAPRGDRGLSLLARGGFQAVLLDVMLPDADGFEVCRRIRAGSDVPVLMLTARGDDTDRIVGLELGADDYLPKPFNPRELLARLRAILRRRTAGPERRALLRFGRLEIDREARTVRLDGRDRPLTSTSSTSSSRWRRARAASSPAIRSWSACGATPSKPTTGASTSTSRGSGRPSRTTRATRGESSPCAARGTYSPARRTSSVARR